MAMTVADYLRGVTAYPLSFRTLSMIAEGRGLDLSSEADAEALRGAPLLLARADVLLWLAGAPNITQGGQSYSFTDEQRKEMKRAAQAVYAELEADNAALHNVVYGYKGSRL